MTPLPAALLCLALAAGLAACGDDEAEPEAPSSETVTYSRSGGVAGLSERIEIEPGGETTIETGNVDPETNSFTLPESQVADVNAALDDAGFDEIESPGDDTGCADCFIYVIERGDHSVTFDDTNFPDELTDAVTELEELVTKEPVGY